MNILKNFLTERQISLASLAEKNILKTRNNTFVTLAYLRVMVSKKKLKLSKENIDALNKEFIFSKNELKNFNSILRSKTAISYNSSKTKSPGVKFSLYTYSQLIEKGNSLTGLFEELNQFSKDFSMIRCIDHKAYASIHSLSTGEVFLEIINKILENRVSAARKQKRVLNILKDFKKEITRQEQIGNIEFIHSLPSSLFLMNLESFYPPQHLLNLDHAKQEVYLKIESGINEANSNFIKWISESNKENGGVVNIKEYKPYKPLVSTKSFFESLYFDDISIQKVELPMMPAIPFFQFFGIKELINIMKVHCENEIGKASE